ncbi:MAG TPA: carboxypeptidase-like regulatory domain-containing protein, partial [Ohtaekwangia sp.]|nr:carboxypeptidase-like regulatory domain-containing protein [Ohtaekwangia sp.]
MKKIYRSFWKTASVFLFLLIAVSAYAQKHRVTGTVRDTEGGPFPGVNVVIRGTTIGTATDGDGNYSIEA